MKIFCQFFSIILVSLTLFSLTQACSQYHSVVSGNTCYDISLIYGISLNDLLNLNPGVNCNLLQIGQQLCVNGGSTGTSCGSYYVIKPGDLCYLIVQNNGISLDQFYNLNPGINCNNLQVGQTVCVSSGGGGGTTGTTSAPVIGGSLVTNTEFINAVTSNGYQRPREDQYNNFVSRAAPDGSITTKRELAMFLAQIMWESGGLIYLSELACALNGCAGSYETADDYPGQRYFGRGYIQLSWAYNYKAASQDLYNDLRLWTNPAQVSANDNIAWSVSFWYWKVNVHSRPGVSSGQFGVTTNAINGGLECSGPYQDKARKRFDIYKKVLTAFNINEAAIESGCYN